eukprot:Selendium_serpulae@DN3974_c0_g1_i1.p1
MEAHKRPRRWRRIRSSLGSNGNGNRKNLSSYSEWRDSLGSYLEVAVKKDNMTHAVPHLVRLAGEGDSTFMRKVRRAQKAMDEVGVDEEDKQTANQAKLKKLWEVLEDQVLGSVMPQQSQLETRFVEFPSKAERESWNLGRVLEEWAKLCDEAEALKIELSKQKARTFIKRSHNISAQQLVCMEISQIWKTSKQNWRGTCLCLWYLSKSALNVHLSTTN